MPDCNMSVLYNVKYHDNDLSQFSFLITGGAGFIGSNLVEYLLKYGAKKVRVLDNFATGYQHNLSEFISNPSFELLNGDITDFETCKKALENIDYVSHQAALGSVPRSIADPLTTNAVNISGFLNMLTAVKENKNIKRFVYAASSSTYGDSRQLPKVEENIGKPLSPYAITKYVNELYADVFAKTYGVRTVGLRYFNVFGPKQSANGAYAAVIPLFIKSVQENQPAIIHGDGEQTRDFTFVENAVQANVKAFFADLADQNNVVVNVAYGERTSLNALWKVISEIGGGNLQPNYIASRTGDVRDSLADISKARNIIGYEPLFSLQRGLALTMKSNNEV